MSCWSCCSKFFFFLSLFETDAIGDANLRLLKKGERIQLERRGYFICDKAYLKPGDDIHLIEIPDGHTTKVASVLSKKITHEKKPEDKKQSKDK